MYARVQSTCPGCWGVILVNEEIEQTSRGWCHVGCSIDNDPDPQPSPAEEEIGTERLHGWSTRTGNTYLAEVEDTEGHPLVVRVKVGTRALPVPECKHRHSVHCTHLELEEIAEEHLGAEWSARVRQEMGWSRATQAHERRNIALEQVAESRKIRGDAP